MRTRLFLFFCEKEESTAVWSTLHTFHLDFDFDGQYHAWLSSTQDRFLMVCFVLVCLGLFIRLIVLGWILVFLSSVFQNLALERKPFSSIFIRSEILAVTILKYHVQSTCRQIITGQYFQSNALLLFSRFAKRMIHSCSQVTLRSVHSSITDDDDDETATDQQQNILTAAATKLYTKSIPSLKQINQSNETIS